MTDPIARKNTAPAIAPPGPASAADPLTRLKTPAAVADTLVLSKQCIGAEDTSPLPKNDKIKHRGPKPHKLTPRQEADVAALEKNRQQMLAREIKGDPVIMDAFGRWGHLDNQAKLAVLQRVVKLEGLVYHFTPAPMSLDAKKKKGDYGAYDSETRKIELGTWGFKDSNPRELVDTVVHEQMHAYQHQKYTQLMTGKLAKDNPLRLEADAWLYNNDHYKDADDNEKAYRQQPLEAHAWDSSGAIMDGVFGKQPAKK